MTLPVVPASAPAFTAPPRRAYTLLGVIQVVDTGDSGTTTSFGIRPVKSAAYKIYALSKPSRIVLDVTTPQRTVWARAHFLGTTGFNAAPPPYTTSVPRPVIPSATAYGALQRLFAGPAQAERTQGLRFVGSGVAGSSRPAIKGGIARIHLTGPCTGGGSTFTVASEIALMPKRFPPVKRVKIYDTAEQTGRSPAAPTPSRR
ncbi:hypothetical protein ACLQ2R_33645 [Streptosporangium sp. DT93]